MRMEDYLITNNIHQYPLYSIGVNSNAYVFEDAIKIIGYARDNIVPILGCDVYFIKNNEIIIPEVFHGWYCDRKVYESLKDYVYRSCSEAMDFIESYIPNEKGTPLFDICLDETWMEKGK